MLVKSILRSKQRLPPDHTAWIRYTDHGISFLYDPKWNIVYDGDVHAESLTWRINTTSNLTYQTPLFTIHRIRNYPSRPGENPIEVYMNAQGKPVPNTRLQVAGREAWRSTILPDKVSSGEDIILLPISEEKGFIELSFQYVGTAEEAKHMIKTITEPVISSFMISENPWKDADLGKTITAHASNTSSWETIQEGNISIKVPGWEIIKEQRDSYEEKTLIIHPKGSSFPLSEETPMIVIGSPVVYSTSGNICGNESCSSIGTITFPADTMTFSTPIIEKRHTGDNTSTITYVFSLYIPQFSKRPTITGQFSTWEEGQEIANILSTLSQIATISEESKKEYILHFSNPDTFTISILGSVKNKNPKTFFELPIKKLEPQSGASTIPESLYQSPDWNQILWYIPDTDEYYELESGGYRTLSIISDEEFIQKKKSSQYTDQESNTLVTTTCTEGNDMIGRVSAKTISCKKRVSDIKNPSHIYDESSHTNCYLPLPRHIWLAYEQPAYPMSTNTDTCTLLSSQGIDSVAQY